MVGTFACCCIYLAAGAFTAASESCQGHPRKSAASVQVLNGTGATECLAVLFSRQHVLTSAACVNDSPPKQLMVRFKRYEPAGQVIYSAVSAAVRAISVHLTEDLAVVQLSNPVNSSDPNIRAVCLPPSNWTGSAWAVTYSANPLNDFQYFVPIWTAANCTDGQICADYLNRDQIACQSRPGIPLLAETAKGIWSVVGLSDGSCAHHPRRYARLSLHLDWLVNQTEIPTDDSTSSRSLTPSLVNRTKPSDPAPDKTPIGCGLNRLAGGRRAGRIIGGSLAAEGAFPWMVSVLKVDGSSLKPFCGGVLISSQHVLTAAHCVKGKPSSKLLVRLGEYDFGRLTGSERDHRIRSVHMHERYSSRTFNNDIAVVQLAIKAKFNEFVRPICLPPPDLSLVERTAYVTGLSTIDSRN